MKKQRFFKITLLASLLVMIFVATASAANFNISHYVDAANQSNANLTAGESTSWTASQDKYILLATGKSVTATVSVDLGENASTDGVIVYWDITTDDNNAAKLSATRTTIASGQRKGQVTVTIKAPSSATDKTYVRITPTFEGFLADTSNTNASTLTAPQSVAANLGLGLGSADIYYKAIAAPTFTVSPDWKAEVDDEEATTPTITATSADANGRLRPFRVAIRAAEGITEDPSSAVKTANEKNMKAYNFSITVAKDAVGDTATKRATGNDAKLKDNTSPDLGYWYIISGDGSVSTPSSGIDVKLTAKNAKGATTKTFKLVIPANTPTIKVMSSSTFNTANTANTAPYIGGKALKNNGLLNLDDKKKDVAMGTDVGEIIVSVDMNLPITWTYNLPTGLTLTPNSDPHTAKIKGKVTTEESWNTTASTDIWFTATSDNDPEMTSTDYFPERLIIGSVPVFDSITPAALTTGTAYSTTISLSKGTATSWDVIIWSGDKGTDGIGGQLMSQDKSLAWGNYWLFSIVSNDDGKSVTITSSNDQALRYVNSKKKFIATVTASNDLGRTTKDFTINVTPTTPEWVEGELPSAPSVGAAMENVFMKFSGALPMTYTMDITADTKNNPGITNVSRDLGIYYKVDSIDISTMANRYAQMFSDDILVVSASQFRNATKKLKVNVNAKNSAGTATKTFTMSIEGKAPVFSDDQDYTIQVAPKAYFNVQLVRPDNYDNYTDAQKEQWLNANDPNYKLFKTGSWISHDEHGDTTVQGSGPITITAKGFKSPVVYNVGSFDLYGENFVDGFGTNTTSVDANTGHLLYVSGKQEGILAGRAPDKGKQTITLTAQNPAGKATKKINIIVVDDPVISTKKALKKLTVGKEYKAAFKSKAKDVTWKLLAYDIGSGWVTDNASADLLDKTGLTFDEEAGTLTGTMESYPTTGGSSIDLKVAVYNVLEREVSGDFNIPLTLTKPKLNLKGKLDLYVGTEMEEPLTFTAETGALSHCIAPKLPAGLELTGPEGESSPYTYTITGTPEAATMTNGKVKAAKVEIELADRAKQTAKKSISITVHPQKLAIDGEEYTADTMEATATQTFNIELPGEGDQSYKWSIKAAKGYDKVKGLKAAINKSTKTTKDNATLKIDFTTKKSAGGTGTFQLIGKNAGDSKVSVSALVSVTVNEATDSAEALKDKDSAEALKDAAEGNEATEATESTSKAETEAADAADAKAEAGITVGGARGENSLTANEKKALEGYVIAAVLPEVTVTEDGQYEIEDVQLKEEIPAGAKLEWFAFPRSASKGDEDIVDFTDNSGAYTEVVPEDHVVTVSPWFNADVVYAPVIAVKADEVNDDDEAKTEE